MTEAATVHRAIVVHEHGGPEVMRLEPSDPGEPEPGQVRVRVAAAGVNFIDVYFRTGFYPRPCPFVAGMEGAGTIERVGPGVSGFAPGDRVAWTSVPGSYAEVVNAAPEMLLHVPDGVSDEQAAASMLQGMTAHYLAHGTRTTRPGDTALVHAAAGGVGLLLVQMLKGAGARVLATCSTEEKAALARGAGADEVVCYTKEDFVPAAHRFGGGAGVDVVYDAVGQSTFEGSLRSLHPRGMLVSFGQASGPIPPFEIRRLTDLGSLFVTRPSLTHYIATRDEFEMRAGAVFTAIASGALHVRIGSRFPLGEAAAAHRALEGRATTGKVLLIP
jgi:NADPH2:quinone reductase